MVSHGQARLANALLNDLRHCTGMDKAILVENISDPVELQIPAGLEVEHRMNTKPLGFAGNHNLSFQGRPEPFFCVANPDLRLPMDPFPALLGCFADPSVGLVAPMVHSSTGTVEDNARHFPTIGGLLRKLVGGHDGRYLAPEISGRPYTPIDWAAGMFMLFRAEAFRDVGGFDDKFRLYYEDVDICARLWKSGWKVMLSPETVVVHDAQRTSRHDPQYMAWHAASMMRFFVKHPGKMSKTDRSG
jgi:GT2 family glycosyltransferase